MIKYASRVEKENCKMSQPLILVEELCWVGKYVKVKLKILPPEDLAQRLEVDHKIGTRAWVTFLPFFPRPSLEVCLGQFITYV